MVTVALMGFASGLPLYLTGSTLKAWLTDSGFSYQAIGLFSLVTLPYALKFLWAPFLDRYVPPVLGRRRGWALIFQAALVLLLLAMAGCDPKLEARHLAVLALLVAFASASQDIVVDAWRREAFQEHALGMANAMAINAYRIAMLASGAGALILAQKFGWRVSYLAMAGMMAAGTTGTFLAWSTDEGNQAPLTMKEAVVDSFRHLARRKAILEIVAFCLLYKIGDQLADAMNTPFLLRGLGFTKVEIGLTTKTVGIVFAIIGGFLGGYFLKKWSLKRALVLFGLCQSASILAFWVLSRAGHVLSVLALAMALENLAFGMGATAYTTFIMLLCERRFTGTQYALLTSLFGFTRGFIASGSGWAVAGLGWSGYYLACAAVSIPGLLLLFRFDRWGIEEDKDAAEV